VPRSSVSLLLGFSAMLSVSLVSRVTARSLHDNKLGVNRHLVSGHEISRLQHGLQLIMARYTHIINCRPRCNLYIVHCQGDRAREPISRPELRNDRHADEGRRTPQKWRSQATWDRQVEGGLWPPSRGVRRRRVCMSVTSSQFWSRKRARDLVIDTRTSVTWVVFLWHKWQRVAVFELLWHGVGLLERVRCFIWI